MNSKLKNKPYVFYALIVLLLILIAGCSAPASTPVAINETTEQEASPDVATKVVETVKAEPAVEKDAETGDTSEAEVQQEDDKEPAPVDEPTPEPTETPVPEPEDTATPEPTNTPGPTDTPAPPAPADTATPTPAPAPDAIVEPATINMRGGPGTEYQVVESYSQGTALDVLGKSKNGSWLQVKAPGGKEGWMSKNLLSIHVALDSIAVAQAPPKPTPKPVASQPGQISAPSLREYHKPTFTWSWPDVNKLQDQDWYFDIQFFTSSGQDPYHVIAAEKENTRQADGLWHFDAPPRECGTVLVQIAQRVNGSFAGWVSPKSNSLSLGPPCEEDPCPGCG